MSVELREVAIIFNGKTPSKTEQRLQGHPVLKIRDVDENGLFRGTFASFVDNELAEKYSDKQLCQHDILILNAAHNAEYVGSKTFYASEGAFGSLITGEWLTIRPEISKINPRYLHHMIQAPFYRRQIRDLVKGIHLYPKDVARSRIPLPSLERQREIAAVLDKVDELRAKRRQSISKLEELLQSTFLEMFGDPVENPKGWEVKKLGELLAESPKIGVIQPAKSEGATKIVRVGELGDWLVKSDKCAYVSLSDSDLQKYSLMPGDLVMARAIGSKEHLGKASLVTSEEEDMTYDSHVMRIRPDKSVLLGDFLGVWLRSPGGRAKFFQHAGQTAVQWNINSKQLAAIGIPLPPIREQQKFTTFFQNYQVISKQQNIHLQQLNTLYSSLQAQFFGAGA